MMKPLPNKRRIVITGIGPMCSLGVGREDLWTSILNERTNIVKEGYSIGDEKWGEFYLHKIPDFNIERFSLPTANFKYIKETRTVKQEDIDLYYLLAVISLAIKDSKLTYDETNNNIGLFLTHENPGAEVFFEELVDSIEKLVFAKPEKKFNKLKMAEMLYYDVCEKRGYNLQTFSYLFSAAKVFDLHGYSLFINNACASGLFAIEAAANQIRTGASCAAIVAAVDNPTKIYKYLWFKDRGLYAEDGHIKPFSQDANGVVFGDGGAAIVLEELEHARKRKAKIYAEYLGGGFSLEGWKTVAPNLMDDFYEKSLREALFVSRINPDEVDFINPHGVGIKVTDLYEARTINKVFKRKKPIVSAFKPLIGHNLGGSGLIEISIALLATQQNLIPGSLNCDKIAKDVDLNIVKKNSRVEVNIFAKMSCGFAGFNGVGIFKKIK